VYRIAYEHKIKGWVENTNECVLIEARGEENDLNDFIKDIEEKAPQASDVRSVESKEINRKEQSNEFKIVKSKNRSNKVTQVSPDIAVCKDCLEDIKAQTHRINYPFTNCTNCGPRFSIIKDLPYDRQMTTMKPFQMCPICQNEYTDVLNRRFHAQPVSCKTCGPKYTLHLPNKEKITDFNQILETVAKQIKSGKIVAIKGLGGFLLICDTKSHKAIQRLREIKKRDKKPFAVMFNSLKKSKKYVKINKAEEKLLTSWRRPIVLLEEKQKLNELINPNLKRLGVMLPYLPLHYLLFEKLIEQGIDSIIATSANLKGEPIIIDNTQALEELLPITEAVLTYDREIHNRVDDSVVQVINNTPRIIRRARGYAPTPIILDSLDVDGIIATGAEEANTFCIGKDTQAILSQHIGDIKNYKSYKFYKQNIDKFKKLFRADPKIIVSDLHPEYNSTKYAKDSTIKHIQVQHHHAHIASVLAENNITDKKVIGISFDGTGYGDDGNIWGGEFLICDLKDYKRHTHFDYTSILNDTRNIWKLGLAYLYKTYGEDVKNLKIPFIAQIKRAIESQAFSTVLQALENNTGTTQTSSVGRLFDAVAAILNISQENTYKAEAPMRSESLVDPSIQQYYKFEIKDTISTNIFIKQIVEDIRNKLGERLIATKFHNTLVQIILRVSQNIRETDKINTVALSGGVFQNKYLLEKSEKLLEKNDFEILKGKEVPVNDGGIALGQLAIAAAKFN
jgi:hydrogenase maturation protein HypF